MDLSRSKLSELRYMYHDIKTLKQINGYIETASSGLVKTLFQIALNILYSNKNNLIIKKNLFQEAATITLRCLLVIL